MESMAGTGIDTAVLTTLGAAFGVMFATLTTLMVSSIRVQHRESTQTRQLITQASEKNRELIEQVTEKNRELVERECAKNRELIEQVTEKNRELVERECAKNRELIEQVTEKNRELVERECAKNRELIEQVTEKNRELVERECALIEQKTETLTTDLNEYKRVTERNHDTVIKSLNNMASSLGDARERLARIEGILRIGLPTATDPESNGGTSEAA
ncbi:MAG: hypothetical protein OXF75_07760 [Acidimicrobiaceae bacterium]|nr:hypothetical protein [Acidimicrobiaceae bacterium]